MYYLVYKTTHPVPRFKKGWSYTSTPPLGLHGILYMVKFFNIHRLLGGKGGRCLGLTTLPPSYIVSVFLEILGASTS